MLRFNASSIRPCLILVALSTVFVFSAPAYAATGSGLPWEQPLQQLANSFAGPVTQSILILAIVALGFALAFSEGPVLRKVLGVILGCAIAATATSFALSFFGFSSGATF